MYINNMSLMDKVGILRRIKLKRLELGYNQNDVAKHIGMTQAQYSRLEAGFAEITLTNLMKLTGFLGLKFSDLDDNGENLPRTDLDTAEGVQREISALRETVKALEKRFNEAKPKIELSEPPTEALKQFLKTKPNEAEVIKWLNDITQPLRENKRKKGSK